MLESSRQRFITYQHLPLPPHTLHIHIHIHNNFCSSIFLPIVQTREIKLNKKMEGGNNNKREKEEIVDVRSVVEAVSANDAGIAPLYQLESLCMRCHQNVHTHSLSFSLSLFSYLFQFLDYNNLFITLEQGITRFLLTLIPHFRKVYTIQSLIFIYLFILLIEYLLLLLIVNPLCRFCCQPLSVHIVVRGKLCIYIFQISNFF